MNKLGISSSCYYPQPTEVSFEKICKSGIKNAEIFFNASSELSDGFIDNLVNLKNEYGMNVISVHTYTGFMDSFNLFTDYVRRFEDGLELYSRLSAAASRLGASFVVMHGAKTYRTVADEVMGERFRKLSSAVASEGAMLLYENVNDYRSSDPYFLKFMMDCAEGKAGSVLDIKQARRAGVPWQSFAQILGSSIKHIHISDFNDAFDCVTPLQGSFDFGEFFGKMSSTGYEGAYIIELYKQSYKNEKDITDCCNLLLEKYGNLC